MVLQNHDELTYELTALGSLSCSTMYIQFRGKEIRGQHWRRTIRGELTEGSPVKHAEYNMIFTTNGIACTTASVIAAAQGIKTLDTIKDDDIEKIRNAHLLLAMFNAWQPGAFALSGWDLVGALPLSLKEADPLLGDGDIRWIHRGAHDLLDFDPKATSSTEGIPKARSLYGSIDSQLEDPESFVSRLQGILKVRSENYLPYATQIDIPEVAHPGMLVMVHRLDGGWISEEDSDIQLTVLNFTGERIEGTIHSETLAPRLTVTDAVTGEDVARVDDLHSFAVALEPYSGMFLIVNH